MTITSLATSTVSWMVTHPSSDRAHGCLTSVIRPWMVVPCQRGSDLCSAVIYQPGGREQKHDISLYWIFIFLFVLKTGCYTQLK